MAKIIRHIYIYIFGVKVYTIFFFVIKFVDPSFRKTARFTSSVSKMIDNREVALTF